MPAKWTNGNETFLKNMFEKLTIDRPDKPIDYLYNLLSKEGLYNVPKVYVLGPPTVDRKLVCTALASRLKLIYLTQKSLIIDVEDKNSKELENQAELSDSSWAELIKKRVETADCLKMGWLLEAFPKTRSQAFALRKAGVFPTHIAVIEEAAVTYQAKGSFKAIVEQDEENKEMVQYAGQRGLILDLHKNSYVKKFSIGKYCEMENSLNKVVDFVRSKKRPSFPYLPRVLLLGPYGSGRKTMAKKIAEKYHLVEIDYQEELRRAALRESPLKQKFYEILKTSKPIPEELLVEVASERLLKEDCIEKGWVMTNFPDTKRQAEILIQALQGFQMNRAIFLEATLETCLDRVEPRRLDPSTGQTYHLKWRPCIQRVPVSRLIQLPQDSAESVKAEHELFSKNASELKDFFRACLPEDIVVEVNANSTLEAVFESVQGAVLKSTKIKLPF